MTGRTYAEARGFERVVRRFASSGPGSWLFTRVAHHLDRAVYRATKGKHLASSLVAGLPVAFVTTTGARSGLRRTVPLVALPTEDGLAIFGSWYGNRRHPAWRHNLRANPEGDVEVRGERWSFRAEEVEGEQRERIWNEVLLTYPGYATYEKRAAPRRISVFILHRV